MSGRLCVINLTDFYSAEKWRNSRSSAARAVNHIPEESRVAVWAETNFSNDGYYMYWEMIVFSGREHSLQRWQEVQDNLVCALGLNREMAQGRPTVRPRSEEWGHVITLQRKMGELAKCNEVMVAGTMSGWEKLCSG